VALAQNRPEEARIFLKEASQLEVNNPDIWFHLGQANQRLGDWSRAKDSFEKAYDLNPRKSEVLYGLSEVNKKLGDREKAREYNRLFKDVSQFEEERNVLEKKLSGKPNSTELRRDLATLLEKNGALEEAMEYLRQAAYLGDEEAPAEMDRLEELLARR
jgi:tetratricopeptide (TPR) repeat protein